MKTKSNFNEIIQEYISKKQNIVCREDKRKVIAQRLYKNWEEIDPSKVSDTQNRVNIISGKRPRNNYFLYNSPSNELYELEKKVNEAYSEILINAKEVNSENIEDFLKARSYRAKFYERGMTSDDLNFIEKSSPEEIIEHIKQSELEMELK
jgi:hypothetical protein